MNSEHTDPPAPERDPGTPIYDQLTSAYTTPAERTLTDAAPPEPAGPDTHGAGEFAATAVVLELFGRMKELEDGDGGWNGGDTVEALCEWFAEFGIDVDADEVAAAQALRVPAWLVRALTAPSLDASSLVIHVRADHDQLLETTRAYLAALVWGLSEETSAAVFDVAGDQIAHIVHPAVDPAQP